MSQRTAQSSTTRSAGRDLPISALSRLAGIPYPTTICARLAALYGLSARGPVGDRLEVFDLLWAVAKCLKDRPPAGCWERTPDGLTCRIDCSSYLQGGVGPELVSILATLDTAMPPGRLHLTLIAVSGDSAAGQNARV